MAKQTVRLPMYDSYGMELPSYLEIDVAVLMAISRNSSGTRNARVVSFPFDEEKE